MVCLGLFTNFRKFGSEGAGLGNFDAIWTINGGFLIFGCYDYGVLGFDDRIVVIGLGEGLGFSNFL